MRARTLSMDTFLLPATSPSTSNRRLDLPRQLRVATPVPSRVEVNELVSEGFCRREPLVWIDGERALVNKVGGGGGEDEIGRHGRSFAVSELVAAEKQETVSLGV